jgi:hypothetical protein
MFDLNHPTNFVHPKTLVQIHISGHWHGTPMSLCADPLALAIVGERQ